MFVLRKAGHRELQRYYSLIELDFDKKELLPRMAIHRAMLKGEMELLVLSDEQTQMDVAYALVMHKSLYGYVLLKYLAVMPWCRGRGIGVEMMRAVNKRYADRQGILAELTAFDDEDGAFLKKQQKFFARFGYVQLPCDYRLGGAPVFLMVKPIKGTWELAPVAHWIIRDFYSRCLSPLAMDKMIDIRAVEKE